MSEVVFPVNTITKSQQLPDFPTNPTITNGVPATQQSTSLSTQNPNFNIQPKVCDGQLLDQLNTGFFGNNKPTGKHLGRQEHLNDSSSSNTLIASHSAINNNRPNTQGATKSKKSSQRTQRKSIEKNRDKNVTGSRMSSPSSIQERRSRSNLTTSVVHPSGIPIESSSSSMRLQNSSPSRKRLPNFDTLQRARAAAEIAIQKRKIFSIHGCYPVIRKCLRKRGWVEKEYKAPKKTRSKDLSDADADDDDDDDDDDANNCATSDDDEDEDEEFYGMVGRLVRNDNPAFIWTSRTMSIDYKYLDKYQLVNHYVNANFTTKAGLCLNMRMLECFTNKSADTFFPRCYRLCNMDEKEDFIHDYRMLCAIGILKIAVYRSSGSYYDENNADREYEENKTGQIPPRTGVQCVPTNIVMCAFRICEMYVSQSKHEDIDLDNDEFDIPDSVYDQIQFYYNKLVTVGAKFEDISDNSIELFRNVLLELKNLNPQDGIDGVKNTWIVKPGAKSRGRGIIVMNKLKEILNIISGDITLKKDSKWIVQKYIERPLLIHSTKFDIRQWYLITDWNPLTVWFYNDCYLRFSSQMFNLKKMDTQIHLCNHAVQRNYENDENRSNALPDENMWSLDEFMNYLSDQKCAEVWWEKVMPGMKEAIIAVSLSSQDTVEYRKNAFELYGADFMLDENFHPWLIEVNASPSLSRSTVVTHKLCKMVQEDTLKVVLDRRKNKNCDTGLFSIIYKQPVIDVPLYVGKNLNVEGTVIKKPYVNISSTNAKKRKNGKKSVPTVERISARRAGNLVEEERRTAIEDNYTMKSVIDGNPSRKNSEVKAYEIAESDTSEDSNDLFTKQQQSVNRLSTFNKKISKKPRGYVGVLRMDENGIAGRPATSNGTDYRSTNTPKVLQARNESRNFMPKIVTASIASGGEYGAGGPFLSHPSPPPGTKVLSGKNANLGLYDHMYPSQNPNAASGAFVKTYLQNRRGQGKQPTSLKVESLNFPLPPRQRVTKSVSPPVPLVHQLQQRHQQQLQQQQLLQEHQQQQQYLQYQKKHQYIQQQTSMMQSCNKRISYQVGEQQPSRTGKSQLYNRTYTNEIKINSFATFDTQDNFRLAPTRFNKSGNSESEGEPSDTQPEEESSPSTEIKGATSHAVIADSLRREVGHILRLRPPEPPKRHVRTRASTIVFKHQRKVKRKANTNITTAKTGLSVTLVPSPMLGGGDKAASAKVNRKRTPASMRSLSHKHKNNLRFRLASLQN